MEHLNARLKTAMSNVGSNKLLIPFEHIAKSLGIVNDVCQKFASESDVSVNKPYHTYPSFSKDFDVIMKDLRATNIFSVIPQHKLINFGYKPLLKNFKWSNIIKWTKEKMIMETTIESYDKTNFSGIHTVAMAQNRFTGKILKYG